MKVVILDNSMMKLVSECSTEATLTAMGKAELKTNGAKEVGTILHTAVAEWLKGMSVHDVLGGMQQDYEWYQRHSEWLFSEEHVGLDSTDPDAKPQYALSNLTAIMGAWLTRHPQPQPLSNLVVPPEWVEVSFEYPLDEFKVGNEKYLLVISGQLDAIGEEGDELFTVETKTTGRIAPWWERKFEGDSQNTEYQWAAEETTGREVMGSYINAIETASLPTSDKTCYKHTYADLGDVERRNLHSKEHPMYSECSVLHAGGKVFMVTRDPQLVVQWKKDAIALAKKYVELQKFVSQGIKGATLTRTQGKFNEACIFCSFRQWCLHAHRDTRFAESMMGENREHREVRVGIFSEEEFNAKS